jgi:hypothetical protein
MPTVVEGSEGDDFEGEGEGEEKKQLHQWRSRRVGETYMQCCDNCGAILRADKENEKNVCNKGRGKVRVTLR